jgi:hypothetical protein
MCVLPMQKEAFVGITGIILSIISVIAGYSWNIIELQVIFSFLAGTFSTYLIQHQLQLETEKRINNKDNNLLLRDEIYGPLYEATNNAFGRIETAEEINPPVRGAYSPAEAIKHTMEKYFFLLADKQRKDEISKLHNDLVEYEKLFYKAENAIIDVASPIIKQKYPKAENFNSIIFRLNDKLITVVSMTLRDAILTQVNPFDKFKEQSNNLEDPTYDFIIPYAHSKIDPADAERIFIDIQEKVSNEKRLIDYWNKRQELLSYISHVLPELRKKVEGKK